ncbi:probable serine/threonine-protein kinase clkA [Bicyclus anynana]|uniref:Probable serine/threonine-protein kinase clkA n=1 Tax=Bicyclus anynana TaxID=110368 RepID=A0A6J1NKW5_BICAN|nr:probable serine/threonine-protein kinase clkA [Bicyclus anynana]
MYVLILSQLMFAANVLSQTPDTKVLAKYDPAELLRKIFNTNDTNTILPRAYGLIQFEGQTLRPNFVNFETDNQEVKNDDIYTHDTVKFQNDEPTYNNNAQYQNTKDGSRKKRRRKRKPKQYNYGLQDPSSPYSPEFGPVPYPTYPGQYYRPPRPRPSLASEALSAVTGALTSIAKYDDYQCVPRLLCEAAAGGALGNSGILQTVSGLQPLLTLLSAYNGVTSNPLFVFGRAALLGASSDSSPSTCRYAYPLCPTDPEQLVHYLNNHNGGFFRFFSAPQQGQQDVEQFYNQLSQNYGLYDPNQGYDPIGNQQNYGLHNQQNYGYYRPGLYSNYDQNYGNRYPYQNNQHIRFKNNDNFSESSNKIEKRIQNKPNTFYIDDLEDENPKWTFPEGNVKPVNYANNQEFNSYSSYDSNDNRINQNYLYNSNRFNDNRKGKTLKFPGAKNEEDYLQTNLDNKPGHFFPDQSNAQYLEYNTATHYNHGNKYDHLQYLNSDYNKYDNKQDYYAQLNQNYDNKYVNNVNANPYYTNNNKYYNHNNGYINNNKYSNYNNDFQNGVQTVYVVRGNGDPNNPEVYKLRPGQTIQ